MKKISSVADLGSGGYIYIYIYIYIYDFFQSMEIVSFDLFIFIENTKVYRTIKVYIESHQAHDVNMR